MVVTFSLVSWVLCCPMCFCRMFFTQRSHRDLLDIGDIASSCVLIFVLGSSMIVRSTGGMRLRLDDFLEEQVMVRGTIFFHACCSADGRNQFSEVDETMQTFFSREFDDFLRTVSSALLLVDCRHILLCFPQS